jgi:uncharacterized protein (DUF58 family)
MGKYFWFLLVVLLGLAIFIGPAGDFVLTLLYLLMGAFLAGRIWSGRSLAQLTIEREFVSHAFLGEQIPVRVEVANPGWLPLVWLRVRESVPVELAPPDSLHQVTSLGGRGKTQFEYMLDCRRRGYYSIGPMSLFTSDVLGLYNPTRSHEPDHFTVFPKIVPLTRVKFKSRSPIGTLRHNQPIFEDPSRIRGKRDYVAGDSLRSIDWKATAVANRLQVKLYEPSIALETAIFLNLNIKEYHRRTAHDDTELAIILAASLANYIVMLHQSVGLFTNGLDPLQEAGVTTSLLPHQGRSHLLRLLETLARLQAGETNPLVQLIHSDSIHLAWGTTVVLITNQVDDSLFDGMFQLRRQGMDSQLLLCGPVAGFSAIQEKASYFGFPLFQFQSERDLDIWRV